MNAPDPKPDSVDWQQILRDADIQPVIDVVHDVAEPDRVHVEHRRRRRIVPHPRRIARNADQVPDARRVRAQQFALNAQNIAVAAAEVVDGLDAGLLLDELAGNLGAHAGAGDAL